MNNDKEKIKKIILNKFPNCPRSIIEFEKQETEFAVYRQNDGNFDFDLFEAHVSSFDSIEEYETHLLENSNFETFKNQ